MTHGEAKNRGRFRPIQQTTMNTIQVSIVLFAAAIVVSIGSRAWYLRSLGDGTAMVYVGLLLGGLLWLLGAYYGYRAIRTERRR